MKPLTKEQFETITKWLANDPDVCDMVYGQFLKDFSNTQEDPEPKAPELWQWQLCPKCNGNKSVPFYPFASTRSIMMDCPVCDGEGKLKIPQSPVDIGQIKDLIMEATKEIQNTTTESLKAGQTIYLNQISSFFTEENKEKYLELFCGNDGINIPKGSVDQRASYRAGALDARERAWNVLKEMAKQKQNKNQQNPKTND